MSQELESRIRERAYQIWEREGHPEGRDLEHWAQAAQELLAEQNKQSKAKSPAAPAAKAPAKAEPIEKTAKVAPAVQKPKAKRA